MKQALRLMAVLAILAAASPSPLWADSVSKTFRVSVTIPERIQLEVPARLRPLHLQHEKLLMRTENFGIGRETNVGKNIDACIVRREFGGQMFQVFTLTVL